MAKVVEQPSSEQSSDNEEINRLFPKCRPRYTQSTGSDVNQNKIFSDTQLSFADRTNSNTSDGIFNTNFQVSGLINQRKMSEGKKHKSQYSETNHDTSILSGYDHHSADTNKDSSADGCRTDKSHRLIYNPDLDIGYHINSRTAACLRESRIEIAGGREIFSKSRSKPSKKRHSDEVVYHPPPPPHLACDTPTEEVKRFSGEVLYDDNFVQYICSLQSSANKTENTKTISEQWVQPRKSNSNGKMYGTTSTQAGTPYEEPKELPSGQLVYETTVRNAEVVYDDIGELTDKRTDPSVNDHNSVSTNSDATISSVPFIGLQETHLIHGVTENNTCHSLRPTTPQPIPQHTQTFTGTDLSVFLQKNKPLAQHLTTESANGTDSQPQSPLVGEKIARVIGNLPIAEYDGSPRRYGPRPGYPHRVLKETEIGKASPKGYEGQMPKNEESDHPSSPSDSCQSQQMENFATVPILNAYYLNSFGMGDNEACYLPNEDANSSLDCDHEDEARAKENSKYSQQGTFHEPEFDDLEYRLYRVNAGNSYIGKRLAQSSDSAYQDSPKSTYCRYNNNTSGSNGTLEDDDLCPSIMVKNDQANQQDEDENPSLVYLPNERGLMLLHERVHQHTLGVDLACGGNTEQDRESMSTFLGTEDLGETEVGEQVDNTRNFTLSPETTDCDSNDVESEVSFEGSLNSSGRLLSSMPILEDGLSSGHSSDGEDPSTHGRLGREDTLDEEEDENCSTRGIRDGVNWCPSKGNRNLVKNNSHLTNSNPALAMMKQQIDEIEEEISKRSTHKSESAQNKFKVEEYLRKHMSNSSQQFHHQLPESDLGYFEDRPGMMGIDNNIIEDESSLGSSPEKRRHSVSAPPPRETVNDVIREIKHAIQMSKSVHLMNPSVEQAPEEPSQPVWIPRLTQPTKGGSEERPERVPGEHPPEDDECDTDQETDRLLGAQRAEEKNFNEEKSLGNGNSGKKKSASKEVLVHEPAVLIEGVLFRARYLGSTQLVCEGQPTKATRMMQAEEAVSRIKAPEGEAQPSTEVDLFISTEKIMVLNTDLKEIMMDHSLRTISYIADIGDLVVLMARRRILSSSEDVSDAKAKRTPKMICHVFESEEAQFIAQSIGQAFQVAYMEFLKANGIEDSSFVKEMDYQEVLNSQEIFGNELEMFAKKEKQKEVVVPKQKGEILGMVIVESGWGSMLPTVVIANMAQTGPAARCGQLNIGDQIIAINGVSLVGLPLSTCQNYIKNTKNQTVVKLTVVPCAPVVEVKIKRPDTKYQLGFSVQNGVICSLLRGGIAERGGVRVGHRIIEINGQSVVAVPHEKIVNLLATSVGEILMKTMPTSMFRLLTGQESPLFI